jgi:hypothetical protein|tara:strand:+ start:503 stop:769 length:267 start_codon:yes stop_codon:yes gene_type:complete
MSDPITTAVDTVSWWSNLWVARDQIMGGGLAVIAAAAMVVGGTKTPAPGSWLGKIYKVIEWASLTFGKAKDTGEREKYVAEEKVEEPK